MKIRIRGNSVRLRLSMSEVESFGKEAFLEDKTEFVNGVLIYSLRSHADIMELSADYKNNSLTVFMPLAMQKEWVSTDIVGFNNNMDIGNGKHLFLLVEKDWVCIDNAIEDQSDNFPNPNSVC